MKKNTRYFKYQKRERIMEKEKMIIKQTNLLDNNLISKLNDIYSELEKNIEVIENLEYANLVNFSENLNLPRHRWFNIKEGFSAEIIKKLIKRFDGKYEDIVFDPFSGSGTTLLTAKELGVKSLGFEVNPFLAFLIENKTFDKSIDLIKHIDLIKNINIEKNVTIPKLSISSKLFGGDLFEVLSIKKYIDSLENIEEKNLLKTAFLCSLEKASKSKKDGNGLKYPKNKKIIPFKEAIIEKIKEINEDINNFKVSKSESKIFNEDVRNLNELTKDKLKDYVNNITLTMFSPPYMNCFDYTEVYKMELWFGDFIKEYEDLKILREKSLTSHLNKKLQEGDHLSKSYITPIMDCINKDTLWNKKIPFMIQGYFEDMFKTLEGIFKLLKKDGYCIVIVGNSAYGNIAIPTDLILGRLGLDIGFKECKIEIARHLGTSSQQSKKINNKSLLRESLVILKK